MGWPPEGTFHLSSVQAVKSIVSHPGRQGHPDKQPYIMVWQDLCENPPEWVRPFLLPAPCETGNTSPTKTPLYSPVPRPILPESQSDLILLDSDGPLPCPPVFLLPYPLWPLPPLPPTPLLPETVPTAPLPSTDSALPEWQEDLRPAQGTCSK